MQQQFDKTRSRSLVIGQQADQPAGVGQRLRGVLLETMQQGRQQRGLGAVGMLPLADAPGVKIVEIGEFKPFQEAALTGRGGLLENVGGKLIQAVFHQCMQLAYIDPDIAGVKTDAVAIGKDARASLVIHQLANFRQAPAQGAARVIQNSHSSSHSCSRRILRWLSAR